MPRRSGIGLEQVADWNNLSAAFWRAATGKRQHPEVVAFAAQINNSLTSLRQSIIEQRAPTGCWTMFYVHDPKRRRILAPCFSDRVLHHALMAQMGPVLERALVDDTFACRPGRGSLAAVQRAQQHIQRFPWFVKTDIQAYFASIDHLRLRQVLQRRFKHPGLLALCDRILTHTPDGPPLGLPIGALTSQFFANNYLDVVDRFLLEHLRVRGMVRYMDDIVWWCDTRTEAKQTLVELRSFVSEKRALLLKSNTHIGRSAQGLAFLGFRVLPGALRLSLRRRRRYAACRARWEEAWRTGEIDSHSLQMGYSAARAITAHADAAGWRREQQRRHPAVDA